MTTVAEFPALTERRYNKREFEIGGHCFVSALFDLGSDEALPSTKSNGVVAGVRKDLTSLSSVDTNLFFPSLFASDAPLNGSIDEFRIYNKALTAEAIAANYSNGPNAVLPAH